MGVLVGIDVRNEDSGRLNLADLSGDLGLDLAGIQATRQRTSGKRLQAVAKSSILGQRRDRSLLNHWLAVDQYNVATDTQLGHSPGQLDGLSERAPLRHQGRRGDYSARVSLDDCTVYARGESKIIRIDDQPL